MNTTVDPKKMKTIAGELSSCVHELNDNINKLVEATKAAQELKDKAKEYDGKELKGNEERSTYGKDDDKLKIVKHFAHVNNSEGGLCSSGMRSITGAPKEGALLQITKILDLTDSDIDAVIECIEAGKEEIETTLAKIEMDKNNAKDTDATSNNASSNNASSNNASSNNASTTGGTTTTGSTGGSGGSSGGGGGGTTHGNPQYRNSSSGGGSSNSKTPSSNTSSSNNQTPSSSNTSSPNVSFSNDKTTTPSSSPSTNTPSSTTPSSTPSSNTPSTKTNPDNPTPGVTVPTGGETTHTGGGTTGSTANYIESGAGVAGGAAAGIVGGSDTTSSSDFEEATDSISSIIGSNKDFTKIPVSDSEPAKSSSGSAVIPVTAGLTTAAAAGIGAKAVMDMKQNNDIKAAEWNGNIETDVDYNDGIVKQETLEDDDDENKISVEDSEEKQQYKTAGSAVVPATAGVGAASAIGIGLMAATNDDDDDDDEENNKF